jgi:predicted CoA-binding protein
MHDDRHGPLIREFLGKKRIAIWGIEDTKHDPGQWVANKFRRQGTQVIGVNPGLKGEATPELVASLTKINPPVEAVLVYVDRPQAMEAVADCIAARVPLVWLHDALSPGAATVEAIARLQAAGCAVIPGLCPMLYLQPVDPAHFCLKWALRMSGKERRVREACLQN